MSRKKITPEQLLVEFKLAKKEFEDARHSLEAIDEQYNAAYLSLLSAKHLYEAALYDYTRCSSDRNMAQKEHETSHNYSVASENFGQISENRRTCIHRFKKAKKVYEKLQKLIEQNQPQ